MNIKLLWINSTANALAINIFKKCQGTPMGKAVFKRKLNIPSTNMIIRNIKRDLEW